MALAKAVRKSRGNSGRTSSRTKTRTTRSTSKTKKRKTPAVEPSYRNELMAVLLFAAAMFAFVSLWSNFGNPISHPSANILGAVGNALATVSVGLFGWCAFGIVFVLLWQPVLLGSRRVAPPLEVQLLEYERFFVRSRLS